MYNSLLSLFSLILLSMVITNNIIISGEVLKVTLRDDSIKNHQTEKDKAMRGDHKTVFDDLSNSIYGIVAIFNGTCDMQSLNNCEGLVPCFNMACKYFNKSSNPLSTSGKQNAGFPKVSSNLKTSILFYPNTCSSNQVKENKILSNVSNFNGAIITPLDASCADRSTGSKCDTLQSCLDLICKYQGQTYSRITFIAPYSCNF